MKKKKKVVKTITVIEKHFSDVMSFFLDVTLRIAVVMGARSSGKSYGWLQGLLIYILEYANYGDRVLILRKTMQSQDNSTWDLFIEFIDSWGVSGKFRINKTRKTITMLKKNIEIIYKGVKDPRRLKSMNNINICFIEEADELTEEDYKVINGTVRGGDQQKMILVLNPFGNISAKNHWIFRNIITPHKENLENATGIQIYQSNFFDNPINKTKPGYYNNMMLYKETDPRRYKTDVLGEFVVDEESIVYPMVDKGVININDYNIIFEGVGLDFGYSDPTAYAHVYVLREKGREWGDKPDIFYVHDCKERQGLSTDQYYDWIMNECGYDGVSPIYADNNQPASIIHLKLLGLNIFPVKKGPNSVMNGIQSVKTHRIVINVGDRHLEKCYNDFCSYRYKTGKDIDQRQIYINVIADGQQDHLLDASRYAVNGYLYHEQDHSYWNNIVCSS